MLVDDDLQAVTLPHRVYAVTTTGVIAASFDPVREKHVAGDIPVDESARFLQTQNMVQQQRRVMRELTASLVHLTSLSLHSLPSLNVLVQVARRICTRTDVPPEV